MVVNRLVALQTENIPHKILNFHYLSDNCEKYRNNDVFLIHFLGAGPTHHGVCPQKRGMRSEIVAGQAEDGKQVTAT